MNNYWIFIREIRAVGRIPPAAHRTESGRIGRIGLCNPKSGYAAATQATRRAPRREAMEGK